MGVWLGPRQSRVEDISVYSPGDVNVFTAKACVYRPSTTWVVGDCEGMAPTVAYKSTYMSASVTTRWNVHREGYMNDSGILVSAGIDLTKYNHVTFNCATLSKASSRCPVIFYVSNKNDFFYNEYSASVGHTPPGDLVQVSGEAVSSDSSVTLDVSNLSGTYYVGILVFAGGATTLGQDRTTSVQLTGITATVQ